MINEEILKPFHDNFILNPNKKIVNGIIKGLNRTGGICPCHQETDIEEDKNCPCKKFREDKICCCNLYIKTNKNENKY